MGCLPIIRNYWLFKAFFATLFHIILQFVFIWYEWSRNCKRIKKKDDNCKRFYWDTGKLFNKILLYSRKQFVKHRQVVGWWNFLTVLSLFIIYLISTIDGNSVTLQLQAQHKQECVSVGYDMLETLFMFNEF